MSALSRLLKAFKRPDPTPDPMPEAIDRASRKSHAAALKREDLKRDDQIKKYYQENRERIRENIKRRLEEADEVPLTMGPEDVGEVPLASVGRTERPMPGLWEDKYPSKVYRKPVSKEDLREHTNIVDPDDMKETVTIMGDEVPLSPAPPDLDAFAKSMQVDPAKFNEALKTMGPSERKALLEAMRKVRPF